MTAEVTREGRVVKKLVAAGSKSERDAIVLESDGAEIVLRRQGGNPFQDEMLESLVGKTVRARGFDLGSSLVMTDWTEI